MTDWGHVVARARGLSGRLLTATQWRGLCMSRDLPGLAAQLSSLGSVALPPAELSASPRELETALRRRAGARLRLLAKWAGAEMVHLAPLFDDEDRRSLRALVRGAVAGVPPDERMADLVPTPALPIRALAQLARARDIAGIFALLTIWRHPFATGLATEARRQHPDLFAMDLGISRAFAARATDTARRTDAAMQLFVSRTIDFENLWTAVTLLDGVTDAAVGSLYVAGGTVLRADDLLLAASTRSAAALASALHPRVTGTPLAGAIDPDRRTREDRGLEALVAEFRRLSLREPLSTAPIVSFVLRQRLELRVLQRIVWGVSLGASRRVIEQAIGLAA